MSDVESKSLKVTILLALIRLLARLPLPLAKALLSPVSLLQRIVPNKTKKVIDINLTTCMSDLSLGDRKRIRNQNIKYNVGLLAEIIHIWFHDYEQNRQLIKSVSGLEAFEEALAQDKGTLVISPHYGNWELVWTYLCNEYKSAGLYRPPRIKELESIRLQGSADVEVVRTRAIDVRRMLKILKQGRSLFVLPDQQPPEGSGVFAPFFGQPAYTMTLLHGLANRTGANIWIATCLDSNNGYELTFNELPLDGSIDLVEFNTALNEHMEAYIRSRPAQYQWSYKRFKKTPDGRPSIYNQSEVKS